MCHTCMRRLALAVLVAAAPARANDGWPDDVKPTAVQAKLDGETAILTARYKLDIAGPTFVRRATQLSLPHGAIATGAVAIAGGMRRRLALAQHDQVDTALTKLHDKGAAGARETMIAIETVD